MASETISLILPKEVQCHWNIRNPSRKGFRKKDTEQKDIYEKYALIDQYKVLIINYKRRNLIKQTAIGVDCNISEPAFDYLHEKYWEQIQICIICLAPDISSPSFGWKYEHSMVLGNLLRYGVSNIAKVVNTRTPHSIKCWWNRNSCKSTKIIIIINDNLMKDKQFFI